MQKAFLCAIVEKKLFCETLGQSFHNWYCWRKEEANGGELPWLPFCHRLILPAAKATLPGSHLGLKASGRIFQESTAQRVPSPFRTLLVSSVMAGTREGKCFLEIFPSLLHPDSLEIWTLAWLGGQPRELSPAENWDIDVFPVEIPSSAISKAVVGEGCGVLVMISFTRAGHDYN